MIKAPADKAFFGRKQGRRIGQQAQDLYHRLLPNYLCDINNLPSDNIILEIGFGHGEHLYHRAMRYHDTMNLIHSPEHIFVGCEVYKNGVTHLLSLLNEKPLSNLMIYHGDALNILQALSENSCQQIYILYPDPWPKKRHHKRRLLNQKTLSLLHHILSPKGQLTIASDHHDYINWILYEIHHYKNFNFKIDSAHDWRYPSQDWIATHYEQKAKSYNQRCYYMNFLADK